MTYVHNGTGAGQSRQLPSISQTKKKGTTLAPTLKSATASETMKALVLVRSCLLLHTRKMMNPFPAIVRIDRIQPRIQNHDSILRFPNQPFGQWRNRLDCTSSNLFPCSKFMLFACKPIVAENLILVLQILNKGKGFLTNKQSKAVKFQTVLVLFREA